MRVLFGVLLLLAGAANAQHRCWDGEGRVVTSKWSCSDLGLNRAPSAAAVQAERQEALRAAQIEANRRPARGRAAYTARQAQTPPVNQGAVPAPAPAAPTPAPAHLVNCDPAGCWATNGQRHNNAAGGNFHRADGKFCQPIGGGQVICH